MKTSIKYSKIQHSNKHNYSNVFLLQIINSDFLFTQSIYKNIRYFAIDSFINVNKNSKFTILDIFQINSSLKQFMRILQEILLFKRFYIYILCYDTFLLSLIKKFVRKYCLVSSQVEFSSNFSDIEKNLNRISFLFILDNSWTKKDSAVKINKLLAKGIFFLNSLSFTFKGSGIYRIYNDISNYKKLIFILILINTKINSIKKK